MLEASSSKIDLPFESNHNLNKVVIMSVSSSSTRTNNSEAIVNPEGQTLAVDEQQTVRGNADGELERDPEKGPGDGETKDPNMVGVL
jgi:hypothetical protein